MREVSETVKNVVSNLKSNPVFRMSLASKELFHSNVLAWLLESDQINGLAEIFAPCDDKGNKLKDYKVLTVLRERSHFDMLVVLLPTMDYDDTIKYNLASIADFFQNLEELPEDLLKKLESCKFAVVENKFKSIPNKTQLEEYKKKAKIKFSKKIKMDDGNTTYYLLAPKVSLDNFEQCDGWERISWNKISEKLSEALETKEKRDPFTAKFLEHYSNFLDNMLKLTKDIEKKLEDNKKYAFPEYQDIRELKKIRIHDFYEKLWFSVLLNKIQISEEKMPKENRYIDYSNSCGILNFNFRNTAKELVYGIQIQQGQFRLFVYPNKYQWKNDEHLVGTIKNYFSDIWKIMKKEKEVFKSHTKQGVGNYGNFKYQYIKIGNNKSIAELTEMINNAVDAICNYDKKALEELTKFLKIPNPDQNG